MSTLIHDGAWVDPAAKLGEDVEVMPGATVTRWAELGDRVLVHPGAVVGGDPQYMGFDRRIPSRVSVGADMVIRESVTLNRSMYEDRATKIGERCFFMACSHVGHDCAVASDVVLANGVLLGGHVEVGAFSFIGGCAAVHQFCRIGAVAMLGGVSPISADVPPFTMAADRNVAVGLNLLGIKRRSWPWEVVREVKMLYRAVVKPAGNMRKTAAALMTGAQSEQAREFLAFFQGGKRGFVRPRPPRAAGAEG